MKNNPQPPTAPVEETAPDESYGLIWPSKTSNTAIMFWCLAALGMIVAIYNLIYTLDYILIASLIGSSITLLWMGHIVNYLKQIANKK